MMEELAASLAHEIKQPIAAALINARLCTDWLRRDSPNITEASKAAGGIAAALTRAVGIIDRLRSLYRRGAPQQEFVDLNEMIREMTVLLADAAKRNSISIRAELQMHLPATTADRVQVQQVLMNLALNGIEAMQDTGGELVIASKRADDGQLLISVSDSGIGLPHDRAERIFEAFFTTKPQGTGMGLSISRRIVESHGGRLWATANGGRGATFQFTLPRDEKASLPTAV
jgi:signal transduction histidine kinase